MIDDSCAHGRDGRGQCYDRDGRGRADVAALVKGVDPEAYAFAFSAGRVARAGAIATVDKEARIPPGASDAEIRARLAAVLRARVGGDGPADLIRAIRPYASGDGALGEPEFRSAAPLPTARRDARARAVRWLCPGRAPRRAPHRNRLQTVRHIDSEAGWAVSESMLCPPAASVCRPGASTC